MYLTIFIIVFNIVCFSIATGIAIDVVRIFKTKQNNKRILKREQERILRIEEHWAQKREKYKERENHKIVYDNLPEYLILPRFALSNSLKISRVEEQWDKDLLLHYYVEQT